MDANRLRIRERSLGGLLLLLSLVPPGCSGGPRALSEFEPDPLDPAVQLTSFEFQSETSTEGDYLDDAQPPLGEEPALLELPQEELPAVDAVPFGTAGETHPIDLANSLALGGANSLLVELARARFVEAEANYDAAEAMWLPSLRVGLVYNKHDGHLQETEGNVLEINRNSLFFGGGGGLGEVPLAAGASGPMRLMANLSIADVAFEPLVASQLIDAAAASTDATFNDALLAIAIAYFDLVDGHVQLINAEQTLEMADQVVKIVSTFEQEGFSSQTEVNRAMAERARWEQAVETARRTALLAGAELARLLRLPAQSVLVPVEARVVPIHVVGTDYTVETLIAQGLRTRPEIWQIDALVEAAGWRTEQERWRPWLPNLQLGVSGGTFGGGPSSDFPNADGRSDVDLAAIWELRNLGYGTDARRRQRRSQLWQAQVQRRIIRDQVAAEVVAASAAVDSLQRQLEITRKAIPAAEKSYQLNTDRIRQGEGLPIEVIQSMRALAEAREAFFRTVVDHNRAQYRLLRAIGQPPGPPSESTEP